MLIGRFQTQVARWVLKAFGNDAFADLDERAQRFLEEALELVQAAGLDKKKAIALVDYVYSRQAGDLCQEVGGTMTTLAALCTATTVDMNSVADQALSDNYYRIDEIRLKQAGKPRL